MSWTKNRFCQNSPTYQISWTHFGCRALLHRDFFKPTKKVYCSVNSRFNFMTRGIRFSVLRLCKRVISIPSISRSFKCLQFNEIWLIQPRICRVRALNALCLELSYKHLFYNIILEEGYSLTGLTIKFAWFERNKTITNTLIFPNKNETTR